MSDDYEFQRRLEAKVAQIKQELEMQVLNVSAECKLLAQQVQDNTAALQEFIELGKNIKFGMKFLKMVEKTAIWITKVGGAFVLTWATWKFLVKEAMAFYLRSK